MDSQDFQEAFTRVIAVAAAAQALPPELLADMLADCEAAMTLDQEQDPIGSLERQSRMMESLRMIKAVIALRNELAEIRRLRLKKAARKSRI